MALNLTGTNIDMRSQMVGLSQQVAHVKRTEKPEETRPQQETRQQEQVRRQQEDVYAPATSQQPKAHERKTQQVIQRFVAQADGSKDAKQLQQKDTQQARESEHTREQQVLGQPKENVPLDNASRIGLMYQQAMRKQKGTKGQIQEHLPQAQQHQLKKFLNNLREYVRMEYKQYTQPDISTYSRRNLREILAALGDDVKAFDNKSAKDRRERSIGVTGTGETKRFNRHYAAQASRQLKLFNEDPMQDPNYQAFEMIA